MDLSSYERDFENARALKTLQENTDPENLVPATKRKVEQAEQHVEPESPNRPPVGALTIAQVWNSDPQAALRIISSRLAGASQHYDCRRSLFQTNAADSCPSLLFLRISSKVRVQLRASFSHRRSPRCSWIEHCAQQGTNALGFRVMTLHAAVPHCTILGVNVMATLSEKKAKKQRAQKHVLQETQLSKAQTGQAALEHASRDPSLTALMARVKAIQKLMRQLKTVAYWALVLDPRSFSSTVENMFAVAIIMDLALIQIVEDENTGVAVVNWEFKQDEKEVDEDALMGRIGDQGLNDEEAAQEQEEAACTDPVERCADVCTFFFFCLTFAVRCPFILLIDVADARFAVRPAQPISTNCISITAKQWRELCDVLEIEDALVQLNRV